jgi:hypothetical protein
MRNKWKKKEIEPPGWLINLVIRERVWRWRMNERVRRWVERQKPWRLRLYFLGLVLVGGVLYTSWLVHLSPVPYDQRVRVQDSMNRAFMQRYDRQRRWDSITDDPGFQRDAILFWRLADSIEADSGLRRLVDSLLRSRPGLADSLQRVKLSVPRFSK